MSKIEEQRHLPRPFHSRSFKIDFLFVFLLPAFNLPHPGVPRKNQSEETGPAPISPVFRTGSEPLLSPRPGHTRPSYPGTFTQGNTHTYTLKIPHLRETDTHTRLFFL